MNIVSMAITGARSSAGPGVLAVHQHTNAVCLSRADNRIDVGQKLTRIEKHHRYNQQIGPGAQRSDLYRRSARDFTQLIDTPASSVRLEDHVNRIELVPGRNDTERRIMAVQWSPPTRDCSPIGDSVQ
jgi:hypothetical protein